MALDNPIFPPMRPIIRWAIKQWSQSGIKCGWMYQSMELIGPRLAENKSLPARLPNGDKVLCQLTDHVQRQIYFQGAYEPVEAFVFSRMIRPGDCVIDAGANIGQYTLLASAAVGVNGEVHCFEPVPPTFTLLSSNVSRSGRSNVRLNNLALWNESTQLELKLEEGMEGNVGSFSVGTKEGSSVFSASAVRLDQYALEHIQKPVSLIKIDIEGAELFALKGMHRLLQENQPIILMEINLKACISLGYLPKDLSDLLVTHHGYTAYIIRVDPLRLEQIVSLDSITQANVIFSKQPLDSLLPKNFSMRSILKWASGRIVLK